MNPRWSRRCECLQSCELNLVEVSSTGRLREWLWSLRFIDWIDNWANTKWNGLHLWRWLLLWIIQTGCNVLWLILIPPRSLGNEDRQNPKKIRLKSHCCKMSFSSFIHWTIISDCKRISCSNSNSNKVYASPAWRILFKLTGFKD